VDLREGVRAPLLVVEALRSLDDLAALDGYTSGMVASAQGLLLEQVDALEITAALADVNDTLTRRLVELAEARLGPPPCAYAWLALGSHGRREQVLSSDQDSALAHADGVAAAPAYFAELAALVVTALARAGLPLCDGGYMATTWCRPVTELRAMFAGWVDRPDPEALLRAEVFLDVRPVHGELPVEVLERTLLVGGSRGPFRVMMARAAVSFRPPLTVFGRLRAAGHAVDLKRAGVTAIVLLARLYALAGGSPARTTLLRLSQSVEAGTLGRPEADALAAAYRFLTGLRLRHQVAQARSGRPVDDLVRLDELSPDEHDRLRTALSQVRDVQDTTAAHFATHTVM
jgi:CBS domain-containing protein